MKSGFNKFKTGGSIISGFAGIGKSTLARDYKVVDLESTPFTQSTNIDKEKIWDAYIDVALHMQNNGYKVVVSAHNQLRERMQERNIDYIFVSPEVSTKEEYIKRYIERKNTDAFIDLLSIKWEDFVQKLNDEEVHITLVSEEYLSDII